MGAIVAFFKKKWVIQLFGIIALSFLIWFIGPLIAIAGKEFLADEFIRYICIGVLFGVWLLSLYISHLKAAKANREMVDALAQQSSDESNSSPYQQESSSELNVLSERFSEAVKILEHSGITSKDGKRGKTNLYELPWYIIIGPPGSGKTTALLNSGLEFPLADHLGGNTIQGVGGTRNCDWWFTNDAVLLDTAGRYTTQDSHAQGDKNAWLGFLDLLKKHRSRRPINGVIIAISLADLLTQSEEERRLHAQTIRKRIQELNDQLGIRFPIYLLLTKSDLVAGFTEFFDDLNSEEREQVWGYTFPLAEADATKSVASEFPAAFDQLLARLDSRLLSRLQDERDIQRRGLILGFPRRLAHLKDSLNQFILETFQPNRYQEAPLLRGIYFSSGTQEGTPIDRLLGNLSRTFNLDRDQMPAFSGQGRSYFLRRLLKEVIFRESGMVGLDQKLEHRRTIIQSVAYVGSLCFIAAALAGWATSFTQNRATSEELNAVVTAYNEAALREEDWSSNVADLLPELNIALNATKVFQEEAPLTMGLGLYQGDKLTPSTVAAYQRILKHRFYPTIKMRLEERLVGLETNDQEVLYELLKAYLMLGDAKHHDKEAIKPWILVDWEQQFAQEPEKLTQLTEHLDALFAMQLDMVKLDENLIAEVRAALTQIPIANQIYGRLKAKSSLNDRFEFRLVDLYQAETNNLLTPLNGHVEDAVIPGLFTIDGYQTIYLKNSLMLIKETVAESWVLGDAVIKRQKELSVEQLRKDINKLYFAEYENRWLTLLKQLNVRRFISLKDATTAMEHLSGIDSPIRLIIESLVHHTQLGKIPAGLEAAGDMANDLTDMATGKAGSALRQAKRLGSGSKLSINPGKVVEKRFVAFHRLLKGSEGNTQLDRLMGELVDLHNYLVDIGGSSDIGGTALADAKKRAAASGKNIMEKLQRRAVRLPVPVNHWIKTLSSKSWGKVIVKANKQLDGIWRSTVLAECRRSFSGRYPFVSDSKKETTLLDFGRIFGEAGVIDKFVSEHLIQFIDTSGVTWKLRKGASQTVKISTSTLQQLQRAAEIRKLYFSQGGQEPHISFGLKPVYLDGDIGRFTLNLDGQINIYQHGPQRLRKFQWPGSEDTEKVTLSYENLSGNQGSISYEGPWAWFHALENADIKQTNQADRYTIGFDIQGHKARYELHAKSVVNPFLAVEFEKFNCPEHL